MFVIHDVAQERCFMSSAFIQETQSQFKKTKWLENAHNLEDIGCAYGQFDVKFSLSFENYLVLNQKHTSNIITYDEFLQKKDQEADGFFWMGNPQNFPLHAIRTADCLAVTFQVYAGDFMACVSLHAGWQGFSSGILEKGLEKIKKAFRDHFSSQPQVQEMFYAYLRVVIGPAIFGVHYECGDDVKNAILDHQEKYHYKNWGNHKDILFKENEETAKVFPDLQLLATINLLEQGVQTDSLILIRKNTFTQEFRYIITFDTGKK